MYAGDPNVKTFPFGISCKSIPEDPMRMGRSAVVFMNIPYKTKRQRELRDGLSKCHQGFEYSAVWRVPRVI